MILQKARNSHDPYPSAQNLFDRGQVEGNEDTLNDVFKKDFIEVAGMKARRKMRKMRIDLYPDAIFGRDLYRKEPRETIDLKVEEAMMYSAVMGTEMLCGMADIIDTVDGMVLEQLERKAEVDGTIVRLRHGLSWRDDRVVVIEEWKEDVTKHMWDIGEAQGGVRGRLTELELRMCQQEALLMGARREIELLSGVVVRQSEVLDIHRQLILMLDQENQRRFERVERMLDPRGRTFANPILIDLDPEDREADEVTLVDRERHVREE